MSLVAERNGLRKDVAKDRERYARAGVLVSCKENCSNCCHVKVSCTPEEVDAILAVRPKIDFDKLERQITDWENADKTCILLDGGRCSVEEVKPFTCIAHLVTSHKDFCHIDSEQKPRLIRTKAACDRIKSLFKRHGVVKLHEEIYKKVST